MVAPLIMAAIGAGMGAIQNAEEERKAKAQRAIEASKARYSPWTGMKPGSVSSPSAMKNIGGGALTGYMMGAGGAADAPAANAGTAGMGQHMGQAFDGSGLTEANANGAPGAAINYGAPDASGFDFSSGLAPQQAVAGPPGYVPPGMSPYEAAMYKNSPWLAMK